ncbi:MAG: ABC transporter ATP-binding protein [Gammaproteobacteria bacterium]|nr:ABC transporter ATP-binding protein [Gammaproteobacteria bacterium]
MSVPVPGQPVLTMSNVGVCFSRRRGLFDQQKIWAVRDVSLDVRHGETLGVIGRNGVGKSTVLRVMAGIINPDSGVLKNYGGYSVSLLALQVGFLSYLTGRENIFLSGMLLGMGRAEISGKLDEIVAFSELDEVIDYPVKTYSLGMKARLGFAISFHADPDVLLIDEVLGVGDAQFRAKSTTAMRGKILSNRTAVLVSHNLEMIGEMCDRVVWLENGTTRALGATDDVLREYVRQVKGRAAPVPAG